MIAPILLPLFSLLTALVSSPTPVLEWEVTQRTASTCTIEIALATTGNPELSKLSLVPRHLTNSISVTPSRISCDDHWVNNNIHNWMWRDNPDVVSLTLQLEWDETEYESKVPLLDIDWEHVNQGKRQRWTLGTIILPRESFSTATTVHPKATRRAKLLDTNSAEVDLQIQQFQAGSFVKITEYIPSHCTCEVTESSGASLRKEENAQIFLWFQAPERQKLAPSYILKCASEVKTLAFDGDLEIAFGTQTKTSHIASVEWMEALPALNENMELNLPPDSSSVTETRTNSRDLHRDTRSNTEVSYAVQLVANHRDLSADEVAAYIGYSGSYTIYRHEGWRKYLLPEVSTYSEAHSVRSNIWTSTLAKDAFVTASLEGERITVQEALLLSNQTWIP